MFHLKSKNSHTISNNHGQKRFSFTRRFDFLEWVIAYNCIALRLIENEVLWTNERKKKTPNESNERKVRVHYFDEMRFVCCVLWPRAKSNHFQPYADLRSWWFSVCFFDFNGLPSFIRKSILWMRLPTSGLTIVYISKRISIMFVRSNFISVACSVEFHQCIQHFHVIILDIS